MTPKQELAALELAMEDEGFSIVGIFRAKANLYHRCVEGIYQEVSNPKMEDGKVSVLTFYPTVELAILQSMEKSHFDRAKYLDKQKQDEVSAIEVFYPDFDPSTVSHDE
jgi:hypothetical protein